MNLVQSRVYWRIVVNLSSPQSESASRPKSREARFKWTKAGSRRVRVMVSTVVRITPTCYD
jgi:hypothetical protein